MWPLLRNLRAEFQKLTELFRTRPRTLFVGPGTESVNGRADCCGFKSEWKPIKNVEFRDLDFTFASFAHSRIEDSLFSNCLFVNADFSNFGDHGNRFERCEFVSVKFNGGYFGYRGSEFLDCRFEQCKFTRTIFSRPEFTNVDFVGCRLRGNDFNGSSFKNCNFSGQLHDVWFRGGFAWQVAVEEEEEFGIPRPNKMENVSFENAELSDLTFSDNCDLSTVKIDSSGKVFLFDKWRQRLERLRSEIVGWEENEQKEAGIFTKVNLVHAAKQDWDIISIEDVEREYGKSVAAKIIASLRADLPGD